MADMLQMTYSEMENLVKALKTSSDDLENLSSQIMSLISDIQNAVGIKWLKTIVSHTDILNNTIYYLNDISSTTSETWQGDRYENFSGKILPSIINASEIITNKEDEFKEGLKAEIKPILEDLQKIAEDFKKQGAECGAQSIWIAQYLKEHQGVEAQSSPVVGEERKKIEEEMNSKSDVSIVPDRELTDEEKAKIREYNDLYEKLHGDEKEKIDKFFENANGFSEEDIENIKYIAYRSKGNAHDVFFKYIDQIKADFSKSGKDASCYSVNDKMIHFNKDSYGKNCPKGSYNTVFHEIGHNIDDLVVSDEGCSNGDFRNITSQKINGRRLYDVIREDVSDNIKRNVDEFNDKEWVKIDDKGKQKIVDALLDRRNAVKLNPRLKMAYQEIYQEYTGKISLGYFDAELGTAIDTNTGLLDGDSNNMVSDIYGGATNNSIVGEWQHSDKGYWYDKNGNHTEKLATEFMAEYFANEMTENPGKENARNYLPKSHEYMDELMKSIL